MNVVNRVALVILLLVVMVLCTILLVVPVWAFDAVARQSSALVDFFNSLHWYVRVPLGILFALVLDIIFILLIILEVRRPARKAIRVEGAAGGDVLISVSSIADRLSYEVDQLSSILRTRSKVSSKRGGVVVELDVDTAAGTDVPEKAGQIVETIQRVVEENMGLKLARPPKVNLRVVPYPSTPRAPTRPKAPAEPQALAELEEDLPILLED